MSAQGKDRKTLGAVLIAVGLGIYLLRGGWLHGLSLLVILGTVFMVAYFVRRKLGLLIPGCILLGLGLGRMASASLSAVADPERLGLGTGFVAIYLIHRMYQGRAPWWPLVPGGLILLSAFDTTQSVSRFLLEHWPLALVAAGVLFLLTPLGGGRRD